MGRAILRFLRFNRRLGTVNSIRAHSSFPGRLHDELTSRQLPLFFDYLHPQPSHLLDLTLTDLFPSASPFVEARRALPSSTRPCPSHLPAGHHLVYFPPQVTLSELLPDGTDTLHTPGSPFNRRLWAGGRVRFPATNPLLLDGTRAVCIEGIRDVVVKGPPGEEKIIVKIERQIGAVQEGEGESDIRRRIWSTSEDMGAYTSILENRDLVFMRDKTREQLNQDKANFSQAARTIKSPTSPEFRYQIMPTKALLFRFSALTFNAHLIHLDKSYTQDVEGYRNLLVHGPLTLTLLLTALQLHLEGKGLMITEIDYKNLAPVYVDEKLTICGKPKSTKDDNVWDVWIEGRDGGLAVRGTIRVEKAQ
ncbi:HotDog domain-containing protein [Aspergillus granulosus]|uniref:HotDog domain-containing protein n=1 Tax=Aspergillus granulosus TaxID=176169 RepID=A0ABR4H214_9EURO